MSDAIIPALPVIIAGNLVFFAATAAFITAMYIIMLIIGIRFLILQGAFFILVTLFSLLIDAIILDPIYIMGCSLVHRTVDSFTSTANR